MILPEIYIMHPLPEHEAAAAQYAAEFAVAGESHIHGSSSLQKAASYAEWLGKLARGGDPAFLTEDAVLSTTFFGVRPADGMIVGTISVRHTLNKFLLGYGGHIGYSVRPSLRRQGYATAMLRQALEFCRTLGIERALVTCDKDNPASARTILRCGGVLEDERPQESGEIIQRYWIPIRGNDA